MSGSEIPVPADVMLVEKTQSWLELLRLESGPTPPSNIFSHPLPPRSSQAEILRVWPLEFSLLSRSFFYALVSLQSWFLFSLPASLLKSSFLFMAGKKKKKMDLSASLQASFKLGYISPTERRTLWSDIDLKHNRIKQICLPSPRLLSFPSKKKNYI